MKKYHLAFILAAIALVLATLFEALGLREAARNIVQYGIMLIGSFLAYTAMNGE